LKVFFVPIQNLGTKNGAQTEKKGFSSFFASKSSEPNFARYRTRIKIRLESYLAGASCKKFGCCALS